MTILEDISGDGTADACQAQACLDVRNDSHGSLDEAGFEAKQGSPYGSRICLGYRCTTQEQVGITFGCAQVSELVGVIMSDVGTNARSHTTVNIRRRTLAFYR